MMKILFAASEVYPFIKTGGLADVMYALPQALSHQGEDVRIILPAYRHAAAACDEVTEIGQLDVQGALDSRHEFRLLQARKKGVDEIVYLVDIPALYDRDGNPYSDENEIVWADNSERFVVFSRAVAAVTEWLATRKGKQRWIADVVHSNDWQTGLVPAFLDEAGMDVATVFTIHNLSYDGYFSHDEFMHLSLPERWWSADYIEFYHGFSMLKAGMVFSDAVTTVSPTYAQEVCTERYGCRFEGILSSLGDRFSGILNGIDTDTWNPVTDPYIKQNYSCDKDMEKHKLINKKDLLKRAGLPQEGGAVMGFIGRLVEQKGVDLITSVLPDLFANTDVRLVMLGSGHSHYQDALLDIMQRWPDRMHVLVGYDEGFAHQIEAGCDIFLMPSMFEPCGLNQMYSLHYGTVPIVTNTGGLADTVVNATLETLTNQTATGFVMQHDDADSLYTSIQSALELYDSKQLWLRLQMTGMRQDFGWDTSAQAYHTLYTQQCEHNQSGDSTTAGSRNE